MYLCTDSDSYGVLRIGFSFENSQLWGEALQQLLRIRPVQPVTYAQPNFVQSIT